MAFNSAYLYLDRAAFNSTTTADVGVGLHKYASDTDLIATITATGYFNNAVQAPESNNTNAPVQLQVGDAILIEGTDATAFYSVTALTPDVTVTAIAAPATEQVTAAGLFTTVGGGATQVISLPGLGITAASVCSVVINTVGVTPRTVTTAACGTNNITVVMSGDPTTDHVLNYIVTPALP